LLRRGIRETCIYIYICVCVCVCVCDCMHLCVACCCQNTAACHIQSVCVYVCVCVSPTHSSESPTCRRMTKCSRLDKGNSVGCFPNDSLMEALARVLDDEDGRPVDFKVVVVCVCACVCVCVCVCE